MRSTVKPDHEELRRRGLELQAALPQPSPRAARRADKRRSEGVDIVDGTADLALNAGLWGVLLAVPGIIMWLWRRLRRSA